MTDAVTTDPSEAGSFAEADLLSWDFVQDPYLTYREMRDRPGPPRLIIKTLTSGLRSWLITEYDDVRRLLADPRLAKGPAGMAPVLANHQVGYRPENALSTESMLFSDPPQHTRLRRMFGRAFTVRRTESLRPRIEEIVDRALDAITSGEPVDLVQAVGVTVPITAIGELLGVPRDAHGDLRIWNQLLTSVDAELADKAKAYGASVAYFKELVTAKAAANDGADDMITAMLNLDGDEQFTETELLSTIFLMMNAGYETTTHLISSTVYALLEHPEQLRALREDHSLIPNAIEESLRYESPLNLATVRYTTEPVTVGETVIPAGELVFLALSSANRDPSRFPDPDRLDVRRSTATHMAFGHGIHHCVGAPLARLEGEIVLRALLDRFPRWEAAEPLDHLSWRYSLQFRGLERLPLRLYR
jgi:cytochrome P450